MILPRPPLPTSVDVKGPVPPPPPAAVPPPVLPTLPAELSGVEVCTKSTLVLLDELEALLLPPPAALPLVNEPDGVLGAAGLVL